ncbi:MAG: alpha/beta fold hydrolase, partial [Chloroflexota bacterium]|nr:alpha/beta fold hydrolase [Chloroflexota bacterium]
YMPLFKDYRRLEAKMIGIKNETFEGTFPFAPHYHSIDGCSIHFVDKGEGEPLVMLHGDPTWGYLYRNFIPSLSQHYRCVVPDHMGMGKSDIPQNRQLYKLHQHIANLEALLLHLDLRDITLVLHDWGGPVGLGFATRHPQRVKRLVLLNTWAFAPWPTNSFPRLVEIIRSEKGENFVLRRNGYLEPALLGTTHYTENLTQTVMEAYRAPFPTPESRIALLCWSRDIPVQETDSSYAEMKRIEQGLSQFAETPILLIWGMKDPVLPPSVLHLWQNLYPHATTYEIEDASHFLQEDASKRIVSHIQQFLEANR